MKYTLPILALAAVSLAAPTSQAPDSFKINSVVSGGSGCPQGSIDINWTDNSILPIFFNQAFTARVGSTTPADSSRKNCQINLSLSYTPGYTFSIYNAAYTGYGDLDAGVTGVVKSTYYFSGSQDQTSSALNIAGPFHGKYYKEDGVGVGVWSACEGEALLNVNSEVALSPLSTAANGVLAAKTEDGRFLSSLFLQWRRC